MGGIESREMNLPSICRERGKKPFSCPLDPIDNAIKSMAFVGDNKKDGVPSRQHLASALQRNVLPLYHRHATKRRKQQLGSMCPQNRLVKP